jgi:hypothetical protein
MQNRYTGDVGDFATYGLLRALSGAGGARLPLGVVWFLVADETRNDDGRYTEYLEAQHERRFKPCDPALFDSLREIVSAGRRSVAAIAESAALPRATVFYERPLSYSQTKPAQRSRARHEWCSGALASTEGCEIVFLAPDSGVAGDAMRRGRSDLKHVFLEEIDRYVTRGQSVVVYRHFGRRGTHVEQIHRLAGTLQQRLSLDRPPISLRYRPWSPRAFFVLPAARHREAIDRRATKMMDGPWREHFESIAQG